MPWAASSVHRGAGFALLAVRCGPSGLCVSQGLGSSAVQCRLGAVQGGAGAVALHLASSVVCPAFGEALPVPEGQAGDRLEVGQGDLGALLL